MPLYTFWSVRYTLITIRKPRFLLIMTSWRLAGTGLTCHRLSIYLMHCTYPIIWWFILKYKLNDDHSLIPGSEHFYIAFDILMLCWDFVIYLGCNFERTFGSVVIMYVMSAVEKKQHFGDDEVTKESQYHQYSGYKWCNH